MLKKTTNSIVLIPFGLLFTLIGIGISLFGISKYKSAQETLNWAQTEGIILSSDVVSKARRSGKKRRTKTFYNSKIVYSYKVNEKNYKSSQVYIGSLNMDVSNDSYAKKQVEKYPVGKKIIVYYSDKNRSNAVLEPGVKKAQYFSLILGLLFSLAGIAILKTSITNLIEVKKGLKPYLSSLAHTHAKNQNNLLSSFDFTQLNNTGEKIWMIKDTNKDFGPFSVQDIFDLYKVKKINDETQCYAHQDGTLKTVSEIIWKQQAG